MPYRIAVIDDDEQMLKKIISLLQTYLSRKDMHCTVQGFRSAHELDLPSYDCYFLDIAMPYVDGIQTALRIRSSGSSSAIVFISSIESRVFEAMRAEPLRFVRKSHLETELNEAVDAVCAHLQRFGSDVLLVTCAYETLSLPVHTILYVESFIKTQSIVTTQGTYEVHRTMEWFEQQLTDRGFLRIHRGYLVNLSAVIYVRTGFAVLSNGAKLPISRGKTEHVTDELTRRLFV